MQANTTLWRSVSSLCKDLRYGGISTHRGAHNSSTWGPALVMGPQFFYWGPSPKEQSVGPHMHEGKHQVSLCNKACLDACVTGNHSVPSSGLDNCMYPWWWLHCKETVFVACFVLETFETVQVNLATNEHGGGPRCEENGPGDPE